MKLWDSLSLTVSLLLLSTAVHARPLLHRRGARTAEGPPVHIRLSVTTPGIRSTQGEGAADTLEEFLPNDFEDTLDFIKVSVSRMRRSSSAAVLLSTTSFITKEKSNNRTRLRREKNKSSIMEGSRRGRGTVRGLEPHRRSGRGPVRGPDPHRRSGRGPVRGLDPHRRSGRGPVRGPDPHRRSGGPVRGLDPHRRSGRGTVRGPNPHRRSGGGPVRGPDPHKRSGRGPVRGLDPHRRSGRGPVRGPNPHRRSRGGPVRGPNPHRRSGRGQGCVLKQIHLNVSDLGLGYRSGEEMIFRYCSGPCRRSQTNYDKILYNLLYNRKLPEQETPPQICCRPIAFDDNLSFLDDNLIYHTVRKHSARKCGCV